MKRHIDVELSLSKGRRIGLNFKIKKKLKLILLNLPEIDT